MPEADRYLTLHLADEEYGISVRKVQEIIGLTNITRVPGTPDFMRGIINLRGKLIPVVDLRKRFGLPFRADTRKSCIIVVETTKKNSGHLTVGAVVDSVSEVLSIGAEQIEPAPALDASVDTKFLLGLGKVGQKVVLLLNIEEVLSGIDTPILSVEATQ